MRCYPACRMRNLRGLVFLGILAAACASVGSPKAQCNQRCDAYKPANAGGWSGAVNWTMADKKKYRNCKQLCRAKSGMAPEGDG